MHTAALASPTDVAGWRGAARRLWSRGARPEEVIWSVGASSDLFADADASAPGASDPPSTALRVPRAFLELSEIVILHRAEDRFALLYRLLWRLASKADLLRDVSDPDVAKARLYEKNVRRAIHKMHAFVRFRRWEDPEAPGEEAYAAWFEPPHHVLERGVGFFVERLANVRFRILTPEASVLWDRKALFFGPGAARGEAPDEDAAEEAWKTYFASIFNPARLNSKMMTQEMAKSYWRNLPEAALIPDLVKTAASRTRSMVAAPATEPPPLTARLAARRGETPAPSTEEESRRSLEEIRRALQTCARCDLGRCATQGVAGEGPEDARVMLIGEQPGDAEDLRGRPFVGPAGRLLDEALSAAGYDREALYVTNAVKHFKHELRGKRRIHKSPDASEIEACRWWLEAERRLVAPRTIIALGGSAARAVLGRPVSILKERGPAGEIDGAKIFLTVHPSYLLRIPDPGPKAEATAAFVADLKAAALAS